MYPLHRYRHLAAEKYYELWDRWIGSSEETAENLNAADMLCNSFDLTANYTRYEGGRGRVSKGATRCVLVGMREEYAVGARPSLVVLVYLVRPGAWGTDSMKHVACSSLEWIQLQGLVVGRKTEQCRPV
jgi:hypothetical protein